MFKFLVFSSFMLSFVFAQNCDELYAKRGQNQDTAFEAINCFEKLKPYDDVVKDAKRLNKLSYLYFFYVNYYEENDDPNSYDLEVIKKFGFNDKESENYSLSLYERSYKIGLESLLKMVKWTGKKLKISMFGPRRFIKKTEFRKLELTEEQAQVLAMSYNSYGVHLLFYLWKLDATEVFAVEIPRVFSATDGMSRLMRKFKSSAFFHSFIFIDGLLYKNLPDILGGSVEKSREYIQKYFEKNNDLGLPGFTGSVIVYADELVFNKDAENVFESEKKKACVMLDKLAKLTDKQIESYYADYTAETRKDSVLSKDLLEKYSCSDYL